MNAQRNVDGGCGGGGESDRLFLAPPRGQRLREERTPVKVKHQVQYSPAGGRWPATSSSGVRSRLDFADYLVPVGSSFSRPSAVPLSSPGAAASRHSWRSTGHRRARAPSNGRRSPVRRCHCSGYGTFKMYRMEEPIFFTFSGGPWE